MSDRYGLVSTILLIVLGCLGNVTAASAQTRMRFDLPMQPLEISLRSVAKSTDINILIDRKLVMGLTAPAVKGDLTIDQVMRRLLSGSGVAYRFLNDHTIVLGRDGVSAGSNPKPTATRLPAEPSRAAEAASDGPGVPSPGGTLEEVVVTAQWRRQRAINVPIAMTVVTGTELQARGATNLQDLQYAIPGLSVLDFSPGQERIQLRGVSGTTGLPTVGRYLDEMNINSDEVSSGFDLRLYDMARVEVLRGPQPTLYGEGAMGGTVHYITVKPNLTRFEGYLEGKGGSQTDGGGIYQTDGTVNLPLIPGRFAARVVGGFEHDGGWIDNAVTGRGNQNSDDIKTARATLLWQPVEDVSVSLLGLHQDTDAANQNFGMRDRTADDILPEPFAEHVNLGNLVISYDARAISLLNSTGYYQRKSTTEVDFSGIFVPLLPLFGFPPGYVSAVGVGGPSDERVLTEELHLVSNGREPLHYLLGTSFRRDRTGNTGTTITLPNPLPFQLIGTTSQYGSTSESLYGELSYAFDSGLEPLVGLRYFHDRQTVDATTTSFGVTPPANVAAADFHSVNPRINVLYHTGESGIVYFNVAKGFRSGGFNTGVGAPPGVNLPPSYGPESLWSYELGTKQELIDRRLSVEAAVYYNRWDNLQTEVFAPGSVIAVITNGGKAGGPGFDLTIAAKPAAGLTVTGTLGLNRMRYLTGTLQHSDGDHIDYTADSTWSLAAEYRRRITRRVTGFIRADYQHSSPLYFTERNLAQIGIRRGDDQNGLNVRFGGSFQGVDAYLFIDNATDWNGLLLPSLDNSPPPVLPRPRTAGAGFRVTF